MTGDGGETATQQVTFYLTPTEQERLKREADRSASSLSAYCANVFREKWADAEAEQIADDLNVEGRIRAMTREATDAVEEAGERIQKDVHDIHDLHARAATYSIVNMYALKRGFDLPEPWINDQFDRASEKLRSDADSPFVDPDVDGDEGLGGSISDRIGRTDDTQQ